MHQIRYLLIFLLNIHVDRDIFLIVIKYENSSPLLYNYLFIMRQRYTVEEVGLPTTAAIMIVHRCKM